MMKKAHLLSKRAALEELWRQGVHGEALLRAQSHLADEFILNCFKKAAQDDLSSHLSVVAFGGYGRQELFPFSHLDIMILHSAENVDNITEVTDAILLPLVNAGLEVTCGVYTVDGAIVRAEDDFSFLVALIDARLIAGSRILYDRLLENYREEVVEGKRKVFVGKILDYRVERRQKFGGHSYLLEPQIKEGRGGMHDVQAMLWTAKVVFGLSSLDELADSGLLTEQERRSFEESWNMLVQLRNRLHYISRKKNDQLLFEQQEEMAFSFGYKTAAGMLGVEQFLRDVYGHLHNISWVTDLFFDHVEEMLGIETDMSASRSVKKIEKGIEVRGNRLHLVALSEEVKSKPHILLRVFLASARTGFKLHYRTLRMITGKLDLITDKVRRSPRMARVFLAILVEAKDVWYVLETMLETGLLQACIQEFKAITSLAQHDLYHIYTVDRHSVQTVVELRKLLDEKSHGVEDVTSIQVLLFAALLHDIGKGSDQDHASRGARMAEEIGKRFGLEEQQISLVVFLVQNHLFITENALKRDLNDPVFIQKCADQIGSMEKLAMLYLLSVADSRATGPSAWSERKAALILEMFLKLKPYFDDKALQDAGELGVLARNGVDWLRGQVAALLAREKNVKVDLACLGSDYISSFTPEAVASHVRLHRDKYALVRQKSLVTATDHDDHWSLVIMSRDSSGLLAKICGVMALNNLEVVNAQIFTWGDGTAVDVIDVRSADGLDFAEKDWKKLNEELDLAINRRLGLGHRLHRKLVGEGRRRVELGTGQESLVDIDNSSSEQFSVIEVHGVDLPGQLYHITQTLADFGVNIRKAFIATEMGQLVDAFYVLDRDGRKITEKAMQKEIIEALLYSITRSYG